MQRFNAFIVYLLLNIVYVSSNCVDHGYMGHLNHVHYVCQYILDKFLYCKLKLFAYWVILHAFLSSADFFQNQLL